MGGGKRWGNRETDGDGQGGGGGQGATQGLTDLATRGDMK